MRVETKLGAFRTKKRNCERFEKKTTVSVSNKIWGRLEKHLGGVFLKTNLGAFWENTESVLNKNM